MLYIPEPREYKDENDKRLDSRSGSNRSIAFGFAVVRAAWGRRRGSCASAGDLVRELLPSKVGVISASAPAGDPFEYCALAEEASAGAAGVTSTASEVLEGLLGGTWRERDRVAGGGMEIPPLSILSLVVSTFDPDFLLIFPELAEERLWLVWLACRDWSDFAESRLLLLSVRCKGTSMDQ